MEIKAKKRSSIVVVSQYPNRRVNELWRTRSGYWKQLKKTCAEIVEIMPDVTHDDGYKRLKVIKTYDVFVSRLVDRNILNMQLTSHTGSTFNVSVRMYQVN